MGCPQGQRYGLPCATMKDIGDIVWVFSVQNGLECNHREKIRMCQMKRKKPPPDPEV